MKLTINQHWEEVEKLGEIAQDMVNIALPMHESEVKRIDDLFIKMDILAFGIVGAVLALNIFTAISSFLIILGMIILIGNAFWDMIARLDQFEINKKTAEQTMHFLASEQNKLIAAYNLLREDTSDETEEKLEVAKSVFRKKLNEKSQVEAPQTIHSKWTGGNRYLQLYIAGLCVIGFGMFFSNTKTLDDRTSRDLNDGQSNVFYILPPNQREEINWRWQRKNIDISRQGLMRP